MYESFLKSLSSVRFLYIKYTNIEQPPTVSPAIRLPSIADFAMLVAAAV